MDSQMEKMGKNEMELRLYTLWFLVSTRFEVVVCMRSLS